jgi:hypothetical protein
LESRDIHLELFRRRKIDHLVKPVHRTDRGKKKTIRRIGIGILGLEDGFFAYNPFSFNNFCVIQGVMNVPVTVQKLNGVAALVFNRYAVTEDIVHLRILIAVALIIRRDRNFYAFCNLLNHSWKNQFFTVQRYDLF